MDQIIRVFCGDMVNANGEFDSMREELAIFVKPPCLNDLITQVRLLLNVGVEEGRVSVHGRFDVGGARAHYMLIKLALENDWKLYKGLAKSQVSCVEVVVDVFMRRTTRSILCCRAVQFDPGG